MQVSSLHMLAFFKSLLAVVTFNVSLLNKNIHCFFSPRLSKQKNDESAEKQHKYIMDDNPVYMIHTKTPHVNNTSKTHE